MAHKRASNLGNLIDHAQEYIIKEEAFQAKRALFAALGEKEERAKRERSEYKTGDQTPKKINAPEGDSLLGDVTLSTRC